ncbi:MAG: fluoride efflux transporter FluC [Clostridia bacterium]
MRKYTYIGIGGFLGAVSRYALKNWQVLNVSNLYHLNIVIINIIGCFILTYFLRLAIDVWEVDTDIRLGISAGFIGAFTTFSTLCRDTVDLLLSGDILFSIISTFLSVIAGLAAIYLGDMGAKKLIKVMELFESNSNS